MTTSHGVTTQPIEPDPSTPSGSDLRSARRSSLLFLAGTVLLPLSGLVHPAPSPDEDWVIGNAAMLAGDRFVQARLLEMTSLVLLLLGFALIARSPSVRRLNAMRTALMALVAALAAAAFGQVTFLLASNEASDLLAGQPTPLFDTHLIIQSLVTPVLALSAAALAVLDARRSSRWTWIPATIAVVGGLLAAGLGPVLAITRDLSYTVLGAGFSLLGVWLLVTAIRRFVSVRRGVDVALT